MQMKICRCSQIFEWNSFEYTFFLRDSLRNGSGNNWFTFVLNFIFCLKNMLFLRFCRWKLYNKCYLAFCDSNAYVIKRLLVGYGNNYMYEFWCVVTIALLTSRNITSHQNSYIYFHIQPITYNYSTGVYIFTIVTKIDIFVI